MRISTELSKINSMNYFFFDFFLRKAVFLSSDFFALAAKYFPANSLSVANFTLRLSRPNFLIFLRPNLSLIDTGAGPVDFLGAGVVSVSDICRFPFLVDLVGYFLVKVA